MRTNDDISKTIDVYGPAVWRACTLHFPNDYDAQNAFQETFLAFALRDEPFKSAEHAKAWLLRVAMNKCRDMLRARHRQDASLEDLSQRPGGDSAPCLVDQSADAQPGEGAGYIIAAINGLGDPPRTALYLNLYEGYSAKEIAEMLGVPVNTVYSWISRGKKSLREALS